MSRRRHKHKSTPKRTPSPSADTWSVVYTAIEKLRTSNLIDFDLDTPRVFLTLECYKAFMCDTQRGLFIDDDRAQAFLSNLRFYLNFQRHYVAGLQEKEEAPPVIDDDQWIDLLVSGSDGESILLVGRWKSGSLELRAAEKTQP